jgi:hypothetical protein
MNKLTGQRQTVGQPEQQRRVVTVQAVSVMVRLLPPGISFVYE